jgi:transcriptional regulator with XRE-family HTH domain
MDEAQETGDDFTSSVDDAIARNVKLAREKAGFSQAELAARLTEAGISGMHQTTIARIESGQRVLRLAEALALARFFDRRIEDWVESPLSGRVRDHLTSLRKGVESFQAAAKELHYRRRSAAVFLDQTFPYTPDAHSIAVVKIPPYLFDGLDELLVTNSEPSALLDYLSWQWLEDARASREIQPFVRGYQMEIYEAILLSSYAAPSVNDYSERTDEEFEAALARFVDE